MQTALEQLGRPQLDAAPSTTALHWLPVEHLTPVYNQLVEGCSALETLTSLLAREGFRGQGHNLELFGLCARCHTMSEAPAFENS